MLETIPMIYAIQVFRRRKLSSLTDKVFTWDVSLKFPKFSKINKYHGIITRKIKDGKWSELSKFMPHWGIQWRKFCVAYNFNWLINLFPSFPLSRIIFLHVCVPRQRRPTATKWNIVQRNILIQRNVVSWWFLSMKATPDDMIAIWVARYCVVTASQSMLIGKRS